MPPAKIPANQRQVLINNCRQALAEGRSLDDALDNWAEDLARKQQKAQKNTSQSSRRHSSPHWQQKLPLVFSFCAGLALIGVALGPLLGYVWQDKIWAFIADSGSLIAPVPEGMVLAATDSTDNVAPTILEDQLDYTNLANWFTDRSYFTNSTIVNTTEINQTLTSDPQQQSTSSSEMRLTIEKLNVHNALIKVGGVNLDVSLIQYETTPSPGALGTTVIFGHSTLRQWYNPAETNPERYKSIFSTIMTLEKGDIIKITANDQEYTYQVTAKKNVKPENVEAILAQDVSANTIRLVTCTPEGTTLMRGLIEATLVEL